MIEKLSDLYTEMLDVPTIWHENVRDLLLPFVDRTSVWPEQTRGFFGGIPKAGHVYIGRVGNGLLKIGFSKTPAERMLAQGLGPLLVILDCQVQHEQALHQIFRSELIRKREMFGGPRVEAFVEGARRAAIRTLRNFHVGYDCLVIETRHTNPEAVEQLVAYVKRANAERIAAHRNRTFQRKSRHWFRVSESSGKAA